MIGFLCQVRDFVKEIPEVHFFSSSTTSSSSQLVIDDESVNFLGRGLYIIIASSNGFLLMAEELRYQRAYYVYNPATRQHLSVPVTPITSCVTFAAGIGFHCKVDDPEKDAISFTIVRFENLYDLVSSVTIESFSSKTNMWSTIDITLDVPISVILHRWTKSASYGVIDGVFCWFDALSQFIFYDTVNTRLWALQLNPEMYAFDGQCLGVLGGDLYYASCNEADITLWYLESNIRSQDAVWVRKYTANLTDALVNYCPWGLEADVESLDFHPANLHIFYLNINGRIISFDSEKNIAELLYDFGQRDHLLFSYEWHQWPRLL
uniref:F-box protein n=2 Tax=Solanum tuberosum TaxID=4113 RepID=M1AM04_SOLTU